MKLFLSIKYHADNANRPQIEGITVALRQFLSETFAAGLVLDALEEPAFVPEGADPQRPLSWLSLWQIPPVLVGRLICGVSSPIRSVDNVPKYQAPF